MTMLAPPETIATTPRLTLRTLTPADRPDLARILGDAEVMRYSISGPLDDQGVDAMLARVADSYAQFGFGHWAVVRREDERLIGFCGLAMQTIDDVRQVEIGYRLTRDAWGLGYATEAAAAARDFGFEQIGLERLIAIIDPANTLSQRVATKIGMTHESDALYYRRCVRIYACYRQAADQNEAN
jgi:ribosomal-protein-alanine N-acetyltransferase